MKSIALLASLLASVAVAQEEAAPEPTPVPIPLPDSTPTPEVRAEAPAVSAETPSYLKRPFVGAGVGVGVLRGITLEANGRWLDDYFSFGFGYAFIPEISQKVEAMNLTLSSDSLYGELRFHPFAGSFFLGGELGRFNLKLNGDGTYKDTVALAGAPATEVEIPIAGKVEYSKTYFAAKLGWFGGVGGGLYFGSDISWQVPLSSDPSVDVTLNSDDPLKKAAFAVAKNQDQYKKNKKELEDFVDLVGEQMGFSWTILKVGWLF